MRSKIIKEGIRTDRKSNEEKKITEVYDKRTVHKKVGQWKLDRPKKLRFHIEDICRLST